MLWILYLLAFIITVRTRTGTWNEASNNNGWTPITRERVFGGFERNMFDEKIAEEVYNRNQNNVAVTTNSVNNQEIIVPRYLNYNTNRNERLSFYNISNGAEPNQENNEYERIVSSSAGYRKPKVISRGYPIFAINNLAFTNKNEENNAQKEKLMKDASVNQYEVTESNEALDLLTQQGNLNIYKNRSDQVKKLNETETVNNANNLTSKLLSILSNYNIRVNDVLPNYELSRNFKRNPPKQEFFLLPIPIRYSSKYNDLNNFAVDPMLVVLLSNYGYNFPGQHGLRNKYSSLYGQLAPNFIHNNKPFDFYKVYSDTDSSQ